MVKFFQQTTTFNYSWDQVAQGFWRRYPNPNSKHVLTEDVVERRLTPEGLLITKRLLSKTNSIPKWAERFVQKAHVNIIEESIVDPKTKTLTTYTRNLGYTKVLSVTEKVIYKESRISPGKTEVLRTAVFDSQVTGFSRAICAFGYERFKKNCSKMGDTSSVAGWEHWKRSLYIYLDAAGIEQDAQKQACLLHFGGPELQEIYNYIPGACMEVTTGRDVYETAITKLDEYFAPQQSEVAGFEFVLAGMFPNNSSSVTASTTVTSKLKDAAKNASELAKAKAAAKVPIYVKLH